MAQQLASGIKEPGADFELQRIVNFSDGVTAIALTLLALNLPLPSGDDNAELWRSFHELLSQQYLSFLLSFAVIGAFWTGHRNVFRYVNKPSPGLALLNMFFLLAIVIIPFATRLLGEKGSSQVATIGYATVVACSGITLLLLLHLARHQHLLRPETPHELPGNITRGVLVPVITFLVSIPVAFIDTSAAKYTWLIAYLVLETTVRIYENRTFARG